MRYHQILSRLAEPQLITPEAWNGVFSIIKARMSGDMPQREGKGICGEEIDIPQMRIEDGIAFIPVSGVMGKGLSPIEKGSGAVDTGDIMDELVFAEGSPEVRSVILEMDTPGGMYQGTPELGNAINKMTKPVIAFTSGLACSAGYWTASCADAFLMTPSAMAGSIGVYMGFYDVTQMLADEGVKAELFTSGPFKGMGFPGVPLTDAQREFLQARVMKMNDSFQAHVLAMRGEVPKAAMQGQAIPADECESMNLCDGVVDGMADAIELAKVMGDKESNLTNS